MSAWFIAALLVGVVQARWLWHDAERPSWYGTMGRYALVAALLVPSARAGHILAVALGWAAAFMIQCLALWWRHRP